MISLYIIKSTGARGFKNCLASFRGGLLSLLEATELAHKARACAPQHPDGSLLLAAPSSWLGLRPETTSMELQALEASQVAREASRLVRQLLEQHPSFQPLGEPGDRALP